MRAKLATKAARSCSIAAALATFACAELDDSGAALEGPDAPLDRGPLVEIEAFEPLPASRDPLAAHRPALVDCPAAAWGLEAGGLEVQTGVCNYVAFGQATAVDVEVGDELVVDLWHDTLDAVAPALGHFAVLLDGQLLAEYEVEIPSAPAVHRLSWTADAPVPAGAELVLHLHNHGYNSWTIVRVELADP